MSEDQLNENVSRVFVRLLQSLLATSKAAIELAMTGDNSKLRQIDSALDFLNGTVREN